IDELLELLQIIKLDRLDQYLTIREKTPKIYENSYKMGNLDTH
ncbi:35_t:CDS:1, partial [Racocetra persica]